MVALFFPTHYMKYLFMIAKQCMQKRKQFVLVEGGYTSIYMYYDFKYLCVTEVGSSVVGLWW